MPVCNDIKCRAVLTWKQPYKKGDRPVNPDGTMHYCKHKNFRPVKRWENSHCKYCGGVFNTNRDPESLNQHISTYHPNGEVITDYDWHKMHSGPDFDKVYKRYWITEDGKRKDV